MQLYLKNGFGGLYARPRYYPDGEDALVMQKSLEDVPEKTAEKKSNHFPEKSFPEPGV